MNKVEQGAAEFAELLKNHELIFIDFWAPWCAPCKQFSIIYELVAEQFSAIQFLKVNCEQQKEMVEFLGIRSIPHLMAIKKGIVVYSDVGSISETNLAELASELIQVDVSGIEALMPT